MPPSSYVSLPLRLRYVVLTLCVGRHSRLGSAAVLEGPDHQREAEDKDDCFTDAPHSPVRLGYQGQGYYSDTGDDSDDDVKTNQPL